MRGSRIRYTHGGNSRNRRSRTQHRDSVLGRDPLGDRDKPASTALGVLGTRRREGGAGVKERKGKETSLSVTNDVIPSSSFLQCTQTICTSLRVHFCAPSLSPIYFNKHGHDTHLTSLRKEVAMRCHINNSLWEAQGVRHSHVSDVRTR